MSPLSRASGREIALGEFPLAGVLSGAETVRAEEIVLTTPDGPSVTTLVNATPSRIRPQSVTVLDRTSAMRQGRATSSLVLGDRTPLHDLRGSFASRALALGESLPMTRRFLHHP